VTIVSQFLGYLFQYFLAYFANILNVLESGGWLVFMIVFFAIMYKIYMNGIQGKFIGSLKWTYLRIRVPEDNVRNPRSMEEALNTIHGIEKKPDLLEIYLDGFIPPWFSLEMRGTSEGVSYIMRVLAGNAPMIQAAIYAQYPDAEIEEVGDYTTPYALENLEKEFDIWGTEMVLSKEDEYPIKTYIDFEDQFAEDSRFVDPMATVSEVMGTLKPGEEIWLQIMARPVFSDSWKDAGKNAALKIAGREVPKKQTMVDQAFETLGNTVAAFVGGGAEAPKKDKGVDLGVLRLTPGEVDLIKAIQRNVSKHAFQTQVRIIYIAAKPVFNRKLRVNAMLGLFRQFAGSNSFKPSPRFTTSRPVYGFIKTRQSYRKNRLLKRYLQRYFGESGFILNTEELATMYHFPVEYVKAPSVERARAKRGEAPQNIPLAPEDLPLA